MKEKVTAPTKDEEIEMLKSVVAALEKDYKILHEAVIDAVGDLDHSDLRLYVAGCLQDALDQVVDLDTETSGAS